MGVIINPEIGVPDPLPMPDLRGSRRSGVKSLVEEHSFLDVCIQYYTDSRTYRLPVLYIRPGALGIEGKLLNLESIDTTSFPGVTAPDLFQKVIDCLNGLEPINQEFVSATLGDALMRDRNRYLMEGGHQLCYREHDMSKVLEKVRKLTESAGSS